MWSGYWYIIFTSFHRNSVIIQIMFICFMCLVLNNRRQGVLKPETMRLDDARLSGRLPVWATYIVSKILTGWTRKFHWLVAVASREKELLRHFGKDKQTGTKTSWSLTSFMQRLSPNIHRSARYKRGEKNRHKPKKNHSVLHGCCLHNLVDVKLNPRPRRCLLLYMTLLHSNAHIYILPTRPVRLHSPGRL